MSSPHCMRIISFICASSRLIGFGACLLGAAVCFSVAFITAPLIPIRPAKFALALRSVQILPIFAPLNHLLMPPSFQPGQCPSDVWVRRMRSEYKFQSLTNLVFRSFAVLVGPINHLKHLVSKERLPFSAAYIVTLALTIYFSVSVSNLVPISTWQQLRWRPRSNRIWGP
jgi:hypothetical protein